MSASWFERALACEPRSGEVAVEGATVRYLRWGEADAPALILVHGGAAHSRWWSFLTPLLATRYAVIAPISAATETAIIDRATATSNGPASCSLWPSPPVCTLLADWEHSLPRRQR